jgi:hypothetical protein
VLFLPEGREAVSTFTDLVMSGVEPPIPYVTPGKDGVYLYLGPVALLIALEQTGRPLNARVVPAGMSIDELKVLTAKATLLRPIHWLAEARAWQILNQPELRDSSTGFYRYVGTKRRRITELLRALQTLDVLQIAPPHLEHRVVSAVGPLIAALDPDFALALIREAERYQWPVRQVIRLAQAWHAAAARQWQARLAVGLPRLTATETKRLATAGLSERDLPTLRPDGVVSYSPVPYPVGVTGLAKLLDGASGSDQDLFTAG